jgi:RIO-like serine/threonine protein kinase
MFVEEVNMIAYCVKHHKRHTFTHGTFTDYNIEIKGKIIKKLGWFCDEVSTQKKPFVNRDVANIIDYNKKNRDKQISEMRAKTEKAAGMVMEHLSDKGYSQGEANYRAGIIRESVFGHS